MYQFINHYADRIGFTGPLAPTTDCLRRFHQAHFYTVPFENFSMRDNAARGLAMDVLRETVVDRVRGGICYETGRLVATFLDACGFEYEMRLANVLGTHRTPATHQVFVVNVDAERWLLDLGFGALGPRGPLLLSDGAEVVHPALSTKVELDVTSPAPRWTVSIKEHAVGAVDWKPIYTFVDAAVGALDVEMAHFFTVHSPASPLTRHKVASIPTPTGRVSVRDDCLTVVSRGQTTTTQINDSEQLEDLLDEHFGLTVPARDLGFEGAPCVS